MGTAIGNQWVVATNLGNMGEVFSLQGNYGKAKEYLMDALRIATDLNALDLMKMFHFHLSEVYAAMGNFKQAYDHHLVFTTLKDSIFNSDKSKEIGRLEGMHEMKMDELKKAQQAAEELKAKTEKKRRKDMLQYSGILILLLIVGLGVAFLLIKKVSPRVAEGVTFFAFLLLFEFLLVLLDPYIDGFSKGEPAYKLLFNALIAACIFPIHSLFEKMLKRNLTKNPAEQNL